MRHLADLPVLLLGLGASGLAMARWCAGHGARLRIWDSRLDGAGRATGPAAEALAPRIDELRSAHPQVEFIGGAFDTPAAADTALAGVRLLLKSPGLAPQDARIAALVERARATGLPLQGELELFSRALADLKAERRYAPRVVAITGTNGKTTTTSMAALLIERAGRRVATAGNIGPTMLDTLAEALAREPVAEAEAVEGGAAEAPGIEAAAAAADAGDAGETAGVEAGSNDGEPDGADPIEAAADEGPAPARVSPPPPAPVFEHLPEVWVLELSSFQLDGVQGFEPDAAAVLNLTQDHLDWHGSMEAYAEAKGRIWGRQAVMVINRDDPAVRALAAALQPAPLKAGARSRGPKPVPRRELRFGLEAPQRPGDYGLVVEGGMAWLVRAHDADETLAPRRRGAAAEPQEIHLQRLMPADALRVRGRHNASNALAALALAGAIGCPLAPMLHGLREYRGEPHRVEYIATIDQVEAYDDSKGTNVGATVAAIDGLGADRAPARLVLLLGGDGKGQDFSPLVEPLRRHARAIATLGRDAAAIEAALQAGLESELADGRLPLQRHDTLEAATRWAFGQARAGDAVLLSPACASLDMFRDYAHRSAVFVDALHELQMAHGETA